ncbi:hypothetical protein C2G38_2199809 [Gigaspora rosea]|uniref:Galactose oxidase n=1 Tax=Gigaspora rosea TaxID=44941 RepID=A0A397UTP4_9GLOM|nr:hypothetical protein C2G38_2199809 [Gigaspora rosea]
MVEDNKFHKGVSRFGCIEYKYLEWSIPYISQKNAPPSLAFHSATIYENYMIISFSLSIPIKNQSYFIYILDIRSYTWVATTAINNLGPLEPTPIPTNAGIPSSSTPTLIIVVSSVAGIALIGSAIAGMFIYKKRQDSRHYIATPGSAQASSLVNNKLYFFGGGQEMPVEVVFASSCVSPIDNSTIFLIGGTISLAYNASVPFYPLEAVIDNDGKIFMFGGSDSNVTNVNITKNAWYNDMHMLDATTMKWSTLNIAQNVPLPCIAYAAVLLPTAEIIILQTTGENIDSRLGHTAVLTQNGNIIIYGGSTINATQVSPDLVVLDINTWEWSIPNIPQKDAPSSLIL